MLGRAHEELTKGHVDLDEAELHRRDAPLPVGRWHHVHLLRVQQLLAARTGSSRTIPPVSSSEFTKPPRAILNR
jgi:hypothetical protein